MFWRKKAEKKIPDDTYRVIKIGEEALLDFISESIIDDQEMFFDVTDGTKIATRFGIDWENHSFIVVAQNVSDELPFGKSVNVKKILDKIDYTTDTMYTWNNRFIDLTQEQIDKFNENE